MAGTVIIPWYATGFRGADLETALNEVAATALRYGASSYAVYRARDDRYKFQQLACFEEKLDWERYWAGPEMTDFRVVHSSWYQVPVLYGWWDLTAGRRARYAGRDKRTREWGRQRSTARRGPEPAEAAAETAADGRLSPAPRGAMVKPAPLQLLPVVLRGLLMAAVDDRLARAVDHLRELVPALEGRRGDVARERAGDVVEGVVVVVADDHPPGVVQAASRRSDPRQLDRLARHHAPE